MGLFGRLDDKKAKIQKVLITVSGTQQEFNKKKLSYYYCESEELNWSESEQTSNHNILIDYQHFANNNMNRYLKIFLATFFFSGC